MPSLLSMSPARNQSWWAQTCGSCVQVATHLKKSPKIAGRHTAYDHPSAGAQGYVTIVGVGDGVAVNVGDGVNVGVFVAVAVAVGDGVHVADGVTVGELVGVTDGVIVGVFVAVGVADGVLVGGGVKVNSAGHTSASFLLGCHTTNCGLKCPHDL